MQNMWTYNIYQLISDDGQGQGEVQKVGYGQGEGEKAGNILLGI